MAFINPTLFMLKIRIALDAMCCENIGGFHSTSFLGLFPLKLGEAGKVLGFHPKEIQENHR